MQGPATLSGAQDVLRALNWLANSIYLPLILLHLYVVARLELAMIRSAL